MSKLRLLAVLTAALFISIGTFDRAAAAQPPLTIQLRHIDGQQALEVYGTAPSGTPLTITVFAAFSWDLPAALLNTWSIQSGSDGRFAIRAPIAGDSFSGTIVTVRAQAPSGADAIASWTVDRPSSQWIPAGDEVPDH